jgi:Uma2 family endonuclease
MSSSTEIAGLVPGVDAAMPPEVVSRLSVDQYHQMIAAGILDEDTPVELLDGWLVPKMTKNPPHRIATDCVRNALQGVLPAGWYVSSQDAITLSTSEPEPDCAVIRGSSSRDYPDRNPGAHDVALVVEVADASLRRDRTTKKRIYAAAGIPFYWIVNLVDKCVEVYTDPSGPTKAPDYQHRRDCAAEDEILVVLDGRQVGVVQVRGVLP